MELLIRAAAEDVQTQLSCINRYHIPSSCFYEARQLPKPKVSPKRALVSSVDGRICVPKNCEMLLRICIAASVVTAVTSLLSIKTLSNTRLLPLQRGSSGERRG
jgi:hypothetical protein